MSSQPVAVQIYPISRATHDPLVMVPPVTLALGPLSPSATVVRGGVAQTVERVTMLLEEAIAEGDGAVLSVFADEAGSTETLAETVTRISRVGEIPHKQLGVTTIGRLTGAGVDVIRVMDKYGAPNHHHVVFVEPLNPAQIQSYVEAWDPAIPNPTGGKVPTK